jgi:putative aldouronate transport system substrate-binding protein
MPEEGEGYNLGELLTEEFTKIIVGLQPVSYFDTIVNMWRTSGGDIVTRAVNREYGGRR